MNCKPNKIIAIDPDVEKNGVAYLYTPTKEIEVQSLRFPALLEFLSNYEASKDVVVVIEASWNTRHNWHGKYGDSRRISAAKGYDVGRNHQTGNLIVEMCQFWGIPVVECYPLKKMWKGPDGKITHDELMNVVRTNGYKFTLARTNQEVRDACLMAINYG